MLGPRDVAIFLSQPDTLATGRPAPFLDADDLSYIARFHRERDRQLALASRTLRRLALTECARVPPAAWRFIAEEHGRPVIAAPVAALPLHFNSAHTAGLVACAVARARDIGIDVETVPPVTPADVVAHCLTAWEQQGLCALPPSARGRRFAELWTLKEAYVKARGLGLLLPLALIAITMEDGRPRLRLDSSLGDDEESWQLRVWAPTAAHSAAVCVRFADGLASTITARWIPG
jgi:4'-phosphopantetheinyl transferase